MSFQSIFNTVVCFFSYYCSLFSLHTVRDTFFRYIQANLACTWEKVQAKMKWYRPVDVVVSGGKAMLGMSRGMPPPKKKKKKKKKKTPTPTHFTFWWIWGNITSVFYLECLDFFVKNCYPLAYFCFQNIMLTDNIYTVLIYNFRVGIGFKKNLFEIELHVLSLFSWTLSPFTGRAGFALFLVELLAIGRLTTSTVIHRQSWFCLVFSGTSRHRQAYY